MYIIPQHIDNNKVFVVKRSELFGRIDPSVYSNNFQFISELFENKKLSEVAFINPTTNLTSLSDDEDISFIQMDAVSEHLGNLKYIETKKVSEKVGFTRFKENDLIWAKITPCMQNGKSAIVRNTINGFALGSTEFFIIRPKCNDVKIEYLHFLLRDKRVLETAMKYFGGSAGQQRVSKDFLLNFNVPIPPITLQEKIVSITNKAYIQKQTKEAEAKELLASIDTYLLGELGIRLPEKNNSLKARIFKTQFTDIIGGRLDPKLYDKTTTDLKRAIVDIDKTKFTTKRLKDILIESIAGDWGVEDEELEVKDFTKCLVIRATEFNNDYNLSLENSRVKYRLIKNEKLLKLNIKEGDLLIEKSGGSPDQPVGRIALITQEELKDKTLAYSNFIHKITVDKTLVNSSYLFSFLKMIHNIKLTEAMQSQTNGIRNLIMATYLGQNIVLPIDKNGKVDLDKQNEIATHIQGIHMQAKALQKEAEQVLTKAKEQVEQMILG